MKRGAGVGLGLLGMALAFGVLGPFGAIAVGWFLLSPDPVASTGRGGGAGAVGAAAVAAKDYLADEWRAGGPARQHRRTARRDRWWDAGGWRRRALATEHALILTWRAIRSAVVAAGRAVAVVPAGAKAGAQAAREHRARRDTDPDHPRDQGPGDDQDRPAASPQQTPAGPAAPAPVAGPTGDQPAPPVPGPSDSGGRPAAGQHTPPAPPTTGDGMSTETTTAPVGSSELTTTDDLRAECAVIAALLEEAAVLGGLLKDWQTGLPEAYEAGNAGGGPKTKALDECVGAVSEAGDDGQALGEALGGIRQACDQADSLGEHAAAMGADGHTKGYVSA